MAILFVQNKISISSVDVASKGATFNNLPSTTNGNFVLACVFNSNSSATNVSSVTDSQSNTYTRIGGSANQGHGMEMWYAKNITGGATPTVTVNFTTNAKVILAITEYSGVNTSSPIDISSFGNTGNSTTPISSSIVTSFLSEMLIGFANVLVDTDTWTAGSGFSDLLTNATGNSQGTIGVEDMTISNVGSYTADFSLSSGGLWEAAIVGIKDASQPTTSTSSTSTSTSTSVSTSTSSTSTSISTSSTSTSISTSSTSTSTTVSATTSTSSTSTSISTSSTSTSRSTSTSISTSSTSTSSSTSLSTSSTSISSSSSISTSSTSTSFSSTSTSTSSTTTIITDDLPAGPLIRPDRPRIDIKVYR